MREVVISDLHVPEHNAWAIELTARILELVKPQALNIAGDGLDFRQLSKYEQNPDRADERLQEELDEWRPVARTLLRSMPEGSVKRYTPGNHEGDRLRRFLWKNPALSSLRVLALQELMGLADLGIEYHEHEIEVVPGSLVVKHGRFVSALSAYSAKRELEHEKHSISTITGHTHRLGAYYTRTRRGIVGAWENGCLCNLDPEWTQRPNWQQGLSIVTHNGGDSFGVEQIAFVGEGNAKKAYVFGNEVRL